MKAVEVSWRDSVGLSRWTAKADVLEFVGQKGYLDCRSVGYLLEKTDDRVVLVQNETADGLSFDHVMTIPREAVTRIRVLK